MLPLKPCSDIVTQVPRTTRSSASTGDKHDSECGQGDGWDWDTGLDLLPQIDPAHVKGVVVDEPRNADDSENDHQDLQAEEGAKA